MKKSAAIDYEHVDVIIRDNYPKLNYRQVSELCVQQGYHCTPNSVRLRVLVLGIKDNSKQDKIQQCKQYIHEHIGTMSFKDMASMLGISTARLGYYTKCMGYSYNYNRTK